MRKQILSVIAVLALAANMTSGAMASAHKAGHARNLHAAGVQGHATKHSRVARARGIEGWGQSNPGYRGGFVDLGPLGITAACGSYRHKQNYCGQGYSVSAWSY
jgi:hypothetical protein